MIGKCNSGKFEYNCMKKGSVECDIEFVVSDAFNADSTQLAPAKGHTVYDHSASFEL